MHRVAVVSEKSLAVDAWESLFRAQVTVLRQLNAEFPTAELSFNEYDVLFNLSRQPQRALRIRDLNRHLLLTQPSVSRLVDRLVQRQLVTKESDPGDGRGTIVRITETGYTLFRRVAVVHAESIRKRVGGILNAEELRQLTALTEKLRLGAR
jgi:DNA-binding MarR family transcriptional regulator